MKKVFMFLMVAGAATMFTACDSSTSSNERVISSDTTAVEYEVERTTVETEVDTTTETETIERERDDQNRQ
jgi:hypothetical protein